MKYKVAIKYLNIINYPYMEEYLENMAREGWLLNKIVLGNIFIFKKSSASGIRVQHISLRNGNLFKQKD